MYYVLIKAWIKYYPKSKNNNSTEEAKGQEEEANTKAAPEKEVLDFRGEYHSEVMAKRVVKEQKALLTFKSQELRRKTRKEVVCYFNPVISQGVKPWEL